MKNLYLKSFLLLTLSLISVSSPGQVPEGFNYMAIARDGDNKLISNKDIGVRIAILDAEETIAWEEEHAVTTDENGLFHLVIGDPGATPVGGYEENFTNIDWTQGEYFVSTSVSLVPETWIPMGSAQLFSVPYALISKTAFGVVGNPFTMYGTGDTVLFMNAVHVKSSYDITDDEALFAVKRKDGQTMFAVYNQGVRINIPMIDNVKGAKGGFAIGGFGTTTKADYTYDLFTLNKDSVRIYLDNYPDLAKKPKGGFAIGGFEITGKAPLPHQNYLFIAPDSARIYVKNPAKGVKGGFAIGGFASTGKAAATNFMDITPDNYFIGHESGSKLPASSPGMYNSIIGYQAGKNLTTGGYNTMVGFNAGLNATSGNNNILIGNYAGNDLTSGIHNTLIGNSAGYSHTNQEYNVMIGTSAGYHINATGWEGSFNTFMGINAGYQIRNSKENVFLGTNAGYWMDNGLGNTIIGIDAGRSRPDPGYMQPPWEYRPTVEANYNTIIGDKAAYYLTSSNNNVIVGNEAGFNITDGDGNVFIGNQAGYNETGNGKLYVTNRIADPPLMYGDFSVNQLGINTKTLGKTLNVGGDAYVSGNLSAGSVTAPVTGNITGNLNGNVTGNVTGNVNGNLTGSVNGVETGSIFLDGNGEIQYTANHEFILRWNMEGTATLENISGKWPCHYWWRMIAKGETTYGKGVVEDIPIQIINGANENGTAFEVHFGFPDPGAGYCSVWVQFIDGILIGHYIKY